MAMHVFVRNLYRHEACSWPFLLCLLDIRADSVNLYTNDKSTHGACLRPTLFGVQNTLEHAGLTVFN